MVSCQPQRRRVSALTSTEQITSSGTTVVFVTHDMEEAVVLADRIVRLVPSPGRIAEVIDLGDLPRPRDPVAQRVAERVRDLRARMVMGPGGLQ